MPRRRRRSPDKLLSEAIAVLGEMVAGSGQAGFGEFETYSHRMMAIARAAETFRRVEADRWGAWPAARLRNMTDQELAEHLEQEARRGNHVAGAN